MKIKFLRLALGKLELDKVRRGGMEFIVDSAKGTPSGGEETRFGVVYQYQRGR